MLGRSQSAGTAGFQEDAPRRPGPPGTDGIIGQLERTPESESLIIALDSYEGPIDLLLDQARLQKIDLSHISVHALADQYLAFIEQAHDLRIELAADYLVMAAWLAYLKSRLLLPPEENDGDEPSGEELAAALTDRLRRLDAMRRAAEGLMGRRLLGRDWHPRGHGGDSIHETKTTVYTATLYDLLKAYADHKRPSEVIGDTYRSRLNLVSVDEAARRLEHLIGTFPGWNRIEAFLPTMLKDRLHSRSAIASHLVAALEMAKAGMIDMRQDRPFSPILIRSATDRCNTGRSDTGDRDQGPRHGDAVPPK
jgi:segregation and condensation protein A